MVARCRLHEEPYIVYCRATFRSHTWAEVHACTDTLVAQLPYLVTWGLISILRDKEECYLFPLWEGSHQIKKNDRPHLLKTFRSLLYAKTEREYIIRQNELRIDDICLRYSHYIKHLQNAYFERKDAWAISVNKHIKLY